jgi:ribose-phosphate pyrophosphokinase
MSDWLVAPGPASPELGEKLAKALNAGIVDLEFRIFPDAESKVRLISDVRNRKVIVVQSTYPPADLHLMQLFLLCHKLSEEGANVLAFVPYLAYARQDREFQKGEVISLGVLAHLLRSVGIKSLLTIDIHSSRGLGYFSFPAYSASAIPLLAEHVKKNFELSSPLALSPDYGGQNRVQAFARLLDLESTALKKVRDRVTGEVTIEDSIQNLNGRDVVIVDDMISTGTSIQRATKFLKKNGAGRIITVCTHALLLGDAHNDILAAGVEEVVATNSIPSLASKIDVTPMISDHYRILES